MSRNERLEIRKAGHRSVLIAVEPSSFQRLIGHVLGGQPDVRVVGGASKRVSSARQAARFAPDFIIVRTRRSQEEHGEVLAELRRSSPASTLILLTHGLSTPIPDPGIDVWLPEDAVVRRLLSAIRKVVPRATKRTPEPAFAGSRT